MTPGAGTAQLTSRVVRRRMRVGCAMRWGVRVDWGVCVGWGRRCSGRHKCRPYGASVALRRLGGDKKTGTALRGAVPVVWDERPDGSTRLVVDGADADAVPVGLAEHVADALAFGGDAVGSDVVFVHEDFLDCFGTRLGDFGVDFGGAFGRGIAFDDDACGGVVAQVGGDALYVGQLGSVDNGLTLAEGDD